MEPPRFLGGVGIAATAHGNAHGNSSTSKNSIEPKCPQNENNTNQRATMIYAPYADYFAHLKRFKVDNKFALVPAVGLTKEEGLQAQIPQKQTMFSYNSAA